MLPLTPWSCAFFRATVNEKRPGVVVTPGLARWRCEVPFCHHRQWIGHGWCADVDRIVGLCHEEGFIELCRAMNMGSSMLSGAVSAALILGVIACHAVKDADPGRWFTQKTIFLQMLAR